ncbi:MAG: hypothetical protein ACREBI_04345 [Nitrosotalea sp.]
MSNMVAVLLCKLLAFVACNVKLSMFVKLENALNTRFGAVPVSAPSDGLV